MENTPTPTENIYPDLSTTDGNSPADKAEDALKQQLFNELENTEKEIATLKEVLHAKEQHAAELRKTLGLTPLAQLKAEINKVQSSQAYQTTQAKVAELNEKVTSSEYYKKTSETLKAAGQATASAFETLGASVSHKFSEMKNSPTYKSFEEKVEGVGSSIMAKVSGTSKDEAKGDAHQNAHSEETPVTQQPSHVDADEVPM